LPDTSRSDLGPLFAALRDLVSWFSAEGTQGVVIGGVAASILGRPRTTADVDALVVLDEALWESFLESGRAWGIRPRVDDALEFAGRSRVLLLQHEPSGVDIDVSLGALPFEEVAVREAQSVEIAGLQVPLPRVEDLVIMKAVAHRGQDLVDIEGLLACHPEAEVETVREVVRQFSELLEMPEILADLEAVIERVR
jgi:predicted nucleotidyltransferase